MKRNLGDLSIDSSLRAWRREEAGVAALNPVCEVASHLGVAGEGGGFDRRGVWLTEEFADFLAGAGAGDDDRSSPNPIFRERLRRRLWRLHALTRLRDGLGIH